MDGQLSNGLSRDVVKLSDSRLRRKRSASAIKSQSVGSETILKKVMSSRIISGVLQKSRQNLIRLYEEFVGIVGWKVM